MAEATSTEIRSQPWFPRRECDARIVAAPPWVLRLFVLCAFCNIILCGVAIWQLVTVLNIASEQVRVNGLEWGVTDGGK